MSPTKTIAVVGVPDEELAHLRLLMRKGAGDLVCRWTWGDENGADLLVVDLGSFAGQMARTRAQSSGVRCAIFSDQPVPGADLVLHRPLTGADVVDVLNRAINEAVAPTQIGQNSADFYTRDLGDGATRAVDSAGAHVPTPVPGLDELLRGEPVELRSGTRWQPAAAHPHGDETGRRAQVAPDISQNPPTAPPRNTASVTKYATRAAMLADTAPHPLRAFLEGDLLQIPARFVLADAAPLVLDTKHRTAYSSVGLGALDVYCREQWRLCDWQPLTSSELAVVRATQNAHSYDRLIWLDVLLHSNGQLAPHFDPGGTYRLTRWLEIEHDLSQYFRVASVMLQPLRLHEIAAASGASMSDVFDLVNAYDAIGLIEWRPRPPRQVEPKATPWLRRLRGPFDKG